MKEWFIHIENEGDYPIAYMGQKEEVAKQKYLTWANRERLPARSKIWSREFVPSGGGILLTIVECAQECHRVEILYEKTDGTRKWRKIEPYSYKPQYGAHGIRFNETDGIIFATEQDIPKIKSFTVCHILQARHTVEKYEPRWDVEF